MDPIIAMERVSKFYHAGFTAVDGIDLTVGAGEFVTLLGPSGCGKTTTLRMIAGFEEPSSGRIRLEGRDITDEPPYRRPVNTVFQDYALFPHLSVFDNVAYGLRTGRSKLRPPEVVERARSALRMVGLLDRAEHRPGQLSGGQRQRVAMARALACRPKVLLLDEPLSALDVKLREAMQVELKHLHQKLGITFLMVTHDQREALVMSDRIVVMHKGRIAQSGTPEDLYDRPASAYVADFVGASNLLHGKLVRREGDIGEVDVGGALLRGLMSPNNRPMATGDSAIVAIRPERVRPTVVANSQPIVEVEIADRHFHGYDLRLEGLIGQQRQKMAIDVRRDSLSAVDDLPEIGARLNVQVNASDAIVFDSIAIDGGEQQEEAA